MDEDYIFTRSLNCAAYILYKTKCVPEIVQSDDIEDYNTFRFERNKEALDAYNLYKSKKSLVENLYINNLFNYNFAIKRCKELIRDYKNNRMEELDEFLIKSKTGAMKRIMEKFERLEKRRNNK